MEGKEELSVICIKVMGGNESIRGVMYMMKSNGLRTEPAGMPQEDVNQDDRSVSHLTWKLRDDRYDLNQLRMEPQMPNHLWLHSQLVHILLRHCRRLCSLSVTLPSGRLS